MVYKAIPVAALPVDNMVFKLKRWPPAGVMARDVGRIRTGQKATFTVDAFPGQTFDGEVRQVRKAAQNVANVVTYIAVVRFSNAAGRLLPGMTANVRVVTDQRENVLKVPNAALRVRLPDGRIDTQRVSASEARLQPGGLPRSGWHRSAHPNPHTAAR